MEAARVERELAQHWLRKPEDQLYAPRQGFDFGAWTDLLSHHFELDAQQVLVMRAEADRQAIAAQGAAYRANEQSFRGMGRGFDARMCGSRSSYH